MGLPLSNKSYHLNIRIYGFFENDYFLLNLCEYTNDLKVDITAFIRELLFRHDCVIIPGFGGLIGNYTPARIDKSTSTFFPPVKQISFNRNLNQNDGLLIGKISGSAEISYVDAKNLVEDFVGDVRKKLNSGEKVVFDHIGSFTNNQEGNIQFEPDPSSNYHLDSYGLESFQWLPLEGYDVRKRIVRNMGKDPLRQAATRKILWRAAVIVPLLSILVAVSLKSDLLKGRIEASNLNPLITAEFEHNKNAADDVIKDKLVKSEEDVIPVAESPVVPEIKLADGTEKSFYWLITGSFKSEKNAISQAEMLRSEGFTPEVIEASNGFFRVSAMVCNDMGSAILKKDSIEKKYPGTWVSKKR